MPTPLEEIIKQQIRDKGPMNLGTYMGLCLGHPTHGYYMTRDPFGTKGDFTTAPEMSQIFGELIGAWIADSWVKMGMPEKCILLECGPGRGTLMADAMRATKNVDGFHNSVQMHLLEMSPVLKKIQAETLAQYGATWHNDLSTLPTDIPVIVIGNEFLDALPSRQLTWHETGWIEKVINLDVNDTLRLHDIEADEEVVEALTPFLIPPNIGDQVEVSLEQQCFLTELMDVVLKQSGIVLFIDYGFVHNVAGDTIQAVKNHRYCGLLETPGEADITAHVNFAEISQIAMKKNMTVHGPVSQGDYLKRLGISIREGLLKKNATELQRRDLEAAVKRLVGEDAKNNEMGALFKVIAFSPRSDIILAGFA